jgi:hypothetical protein
VVLARASAQHVIHILEHGADSDAILSPPAAASVPADRLAPQAQRLANEFDVKGQDTRGRVFSDDYRQFVAPLLIKTDVPDSKAAAAELVHVLTDLIDKGGAPTAQWTARTKDLHNLYVSERKSMACDEAFDEAALKWAETTSFLPSEKAGKAIASTMPLAVVFVLTDS